MLARRWSSQIREPFRFGIVGVANTVTGLAVIFAALALGLGDVPANMLGYAAGLAQGFVLNRRWTFQRDVRQVRREVLRYVLAFAPAYAINVLIVAGLVSAGVVANPLTHVLGIVAYTIVFYLLCAHFVFKPARPTGDVLSRVENAGRTAVPTGGTSRPRLSDLFEYRWSAELLAALALAAAYTLLRDMRITHDVVWQFWIARQMLHGAGLYTDILEINPPMWFWSAMPLEALAEFAGLPSRRIAIAAIFVLVAISVWLLARLFAEERPERRAALLLLACVALIVVPLSDFGQREHLALIGALPYDALIARRVEGRPTSIMLAALTGLIAAYGFSLKHYFVAVPALLEFWLAMRGRLPWSPARPETIVLGVFAALYGAAMWLAAPGFFANVLPMVDLAYDGYAFPFIKQATMLWVPLWVIGALAVARVGRVAPPVVMASALAMLGFVLSYFAQQKGWRYHALSASGCLTFAAGLAIVLRRDTRWRWIWHPELPLACVLPVALGLIGGPYANPYEAEIGRILASVPRGASVAMFSVNATLIWPMIDDASLTWPLRHFTFWMIPAIARAEAQAGPAGVSPRMAELERGIQRDTAEDLWCRPPQLIVVDDTRYSTSMSGTNFNILDFFGRDPAIGDLMKHYRRTGVVDRFTIYSRTEELATPAGMKCRPVVASR
jgi:putative flippase GtrA